MGKSKKSSIGYRTLVGLGATMLLASMLSMLGIQSAAAQSTVPISVQAQVVGGSATVADVAITLSGNGTDISVTGTTGISGVQVTPGATYSLTSVIGATGYNSQWVCRSGVSVSGGFVTIPADATEVECTVYHAAATQVPVNVSLTVVNDGNGSATAADFDLELFDSAGSFLDSGIAGSGLWSTTAPAGSYMIGISGLGEYSVDSASCAATTGADSGEDEALSGTAFTIAANTTVVNCSITVNDPAVPPTATPVPPTATPVPATANPSPGDGHPGSRNRRARHRSAGNRSPRDGCSGHRSARHCSARHRSAR